MKVAAIPWSILTGIALVVTAGTAFLIVRGPFLGGQMLAPLPLLGAVCAFVGIMMTAWSGEKLFRVHV